MTTAAVPPNGTCTVSLADESATAALAACLADVLEPGMVMGLSGPLGAGKTTLVRALLRRLGYTDRVRSPTFTLMEPYNLSRFDVYHFDFYRLSSQDEWRHAGFQDYFGGAGVCLVEWPEHAGAALAQPDLQLNLAFAVPDAPSHARSLQCHAYSPAGLRCLNILRAATF